VAILKTGIIIAIALCIGACVTSFVHGAETNAPTPQAAAELTRDTLWSAYRLSQDAGAEVRMELPNAMLLAIGWSTSFGPGQHIGERPEPWWRRGKVWAGSGLVAGGIGLTAAAMNAGLIGEPHYGKGTEAEQQRDKDAARADGNTTSVSVNQEGEGEKNSRITVYIANIFRGEDPEK
jgi:hypothetical protein